MNNTVQADIQETFDSFVQALKNDDFEAFQKVHSLKMDEPVSREQFQANVAMVQRHQLEYRIEGIELRAEACRAVLHFSVRSPKNPDRVEKDKLLLCYEVWEWRILES